MFDSLQLILSLTLIATEPLDQIMDTLTDIMVEVVRINKKILRSVQNLHSKIAPSRGNLLVTILAIWLKLNFLGLKKFSIWPYVQLIQTTFISIFSMSCLFELKFCAVSRNRFWFFVFNRSAIDLFKLLAS